MADHTLVGSVGTVVRTIRGGRMPGEIRVVDGGEVAMLMAYSDEPIEAGRRVRVTAGHGPRQVVVRAWP